MCVLNDRGQVQELVQAATVLPKPGLTVTQDASRFTKAAEQVGKAGGPQFIRTVCKPDRPKIG